jgi:hypothetical protein
MNPSDPTGICTVVNPDPGAGGAFAVVREALAPVPFRLVA